MSENEFVAWPSFIRERFLFDVFDNADDYDRADEVLRVLGRQVDALLVTGVSQNYATKRGYF